MIFNSNKNALLSLVHGFRPCAFEGIHTSRVYNEKNLYEVLNLEKNCSTKEIRESFLSLAKKYHPDANPNDPKSHARFVELQAAYSVLSSPSKRTDYDLNLHGTSGHYSNYPNSPNYPGRPYRRPAESPDYEVHFDDQYRDIFSRSRMRTNAPPPPHRVGILQVSLLLFAFTTVGALAQYFVIKRNDGLNMPEPSPDPYPDPYPGPLYDRPFFMRWLYKRGVNEEMERHTRGTASFYALKEEMDKRAEEYDVKKLRAAYFKEVGQGHIGMHLVPKLIRPELPQELPEEVPRVPNLDPPVVKN